MAACGFDEAGFKRPQSLPPSVSLRRRSFQNDLNASILSPALRRIIRRYQTRFAESFGRPDIGVEALRTKIRDNVGGSPRREIDAIGHAHSV
jgi:hypothetical protein